MYRTNANTCSRQNFRIFNIIKHNGSVCYVHVIVRCEEVHYDLEPSVDDSFGYGQWQKFVHEIWTNKIYTHLVWIKFNTKLNSNTLNTMV